MRRITSFVCAGAMLAWAAHSSRTVLATASLCSGALGQSGWLCETVDAAGDVGSLNHSIYGPDGAVHVAYTANIQLQGLKYKTALKYARRNNAGTWTTQIVDGSVGGAQGMLINPVTGQPAIGYGCLKFAEWIGTAWSLQTVVKDCGDSAATFAFDPAGTVFAAYSDKRTWRLNVGKRTGSTWSFQMLLPEASYMSMAVAADGFPAIAFENRANALVYGHQQPGGSWQFTTVDTATTLIARVTLRFTDTGSPAIAYRVDNSIRLGTQNALTGAWSVETIHTLPPGNTIDGVSLAFATGEPVVTFGATPDSTRVLTFTAARRVTGSASWSLASLEIMPGAMLMSARADYNPGTGLIGVSYGPRGSSWNDLKFAEGPPGVIVP